MIRGLERELKGVEVSEIMVSTPVPDVSAPAEIITITEEEIVATLPVKKSIEEEKVKEEVLQHSAPIPETIIPNIQTQEVPEEILQEKVKITAPLSEKTENEIPQEREQKTTSPEAPSKHSPDPHQKTFDSLVKKIYDRNYELGACFERNIEFESFSDNKLTWGSSAQGDNKKQLITHWGVINMFVKELFGFETKIVNIAKKKTNTTKKLEQTRRVAPKGATLQQNIPHTDADSGSMIEDIEMKSSCIAPDAGGTEAAKEKDPSTLLEEPMIKEAIALFDPKKVRIKRNS